MSFNQSEKNFIAHRADAMVSAMQHSILHCGIPLDLSCEYESRLKAMAYMMAELIDEFHEFGIERREVWRVFSSNVEEYMLMMNS